MNIRVKGALFGALSFALLAAKAVAQTYKVETESTPAPRELAAGIRETLAGEAFRITAAQGALCEIWLRKAVPAQAAASQELGVAFGQLGEGTLVGAIRWDTEAEDYRGQQIEPGVYTLRYALQPVDGNHQGVSPYRDFLLLAPAALDSSPGPIGTKELYTLSRKASGTGHPAVWSLLPADEAPAVLPAITHQEDGDLWVFYFRAPLEAAGGTPTPTVMGLVVVGHAPES